MAGDPWWTCAIFYQIYPRSFVDGNGDGTGDLAGIRSRLDYLSDLGVDALWLSPFYRSPMADGGYDVADPCQVDPLFGTLDDFDALVADAHARGIKVTIDMVPNHVSNEHPWFVEALAASPGDPARDRFYFRPGRGPNGAQPPNNWPSVFGGSAWTRLDDGEWYLHLFAPEQPDLNWDCPDVPAEFHRVFRFWLDRGVDGFRIDVAHGMAKAPGLPDVDLSAIGPPDTTEWTPSGKDIRWDRDGVHEILRGFRRVFNEYDAMAVGEAWVPDPDRLARYVRPDELNLVFNFELLEAKWGAGTFRQAIERSMYAMCEVEAVCTWVLSNHDVPRAATRFGSVARARAAALVQLSLPGSVYLYNGDELGLTNVQLPDSALQDPTWERSGHTERGRDGERVPMPWSGSQPPFGFSTSERTWLPMPTDWAPVTVEAQSADPSSTLTLFRAALRIRRSTPQLHDGTFEWIDAPPDCLSFRRDAVTVLLNAGTTPVARPEGDVLLSSQPLDGDDVPPDTTVWVRG